MHSGFLDRDEKLGIGAKLYPDLQVEVHAWPDGFVALESAREGCRGGEAGRMQIVSRDRTVRTLSDAERTQLRAWVDARLADWKSSPLVARAHAPRIEKLEELARRMDL
ncbi:MAG: hypothetical protein IPJ65_15540 [Archangiaceae bacterium]|nr:hypothetical protein [Archangiaceae bacterium]